MKRATSSPTVGFRLSAAVHAKLLQQAGNHGASPGEFARELVTDALNSESRLEKLEQSVADIRDSIEALRLSMERSVGAILLHAGKANAEEARAFVAKTFRNQGGSSS